ncbi:hypothetical protein SFRURICE_008965 [Spodoptera frugiperda]|uniref:SFRICE_022451 n=1 Tax=Spodoptera frugiperda TaxID=7108 RepID=A0A2H1WMS5_SPOFR|nr:hypothetical protein SFRURICE_008965 [Spodoptera frugiperda]
MVGSLKGLERGRNSGVASSISTSSILVGCHMYTFKKIDDIFRHIRRKDRPVNRFPKSLRDKDRFLNADKYRIKDAMDSAISAISSAAVHLSSSKSSIAYTSFYRGLLEYTGRLEIAMLGTITARLARWLGNWLQYNV